MPLPGRLGMEGAGVIEAVGEGVADLQVGDRGLCQPAPGRLQQPPCDARALCAASAGWHRLRHCCSHDAPAGLTVVPAAPHLPQGGLQAGEFVLFHAAAGGVGLIACQWARALGLRLIATAGSDERCQTAIAHGASSPSTTAASRTSPRGCVRSPAAVASAWSTTRWAPTPGRAR